METKSQNGELERLTRKVRRLERLLGLVFAAGLLGTCVASMQPSPEIVRARKFSVIDEDGKTVAFFGADIDSTSSGIRRGRWPRRGRCCPG
jgi:hypothetical protein